MNSLRERYYALIRNRSAFLLLLLILGFFLRVYDLDTESLWLDEGLSLEIAKLPLSQIATIETNPTLYYMLLHWWINIFGASEFSIRFPSVIFSFLSLCMMYKTGNLIGDRNVGIFSTTLLGLSVFHIHYAQEVRTYSLLALLALLSMYYFLKLLKEKDRFDMIGYTLFSVLLTYSHIYGSFIIMAQNIYIFTVYLLAKKSCTIKPGRWVLLQAIIAVLFIPWIMVLVYYPNLLRGIKWIPIPSVGAIINSFIAYAGNVRLLPLLLLLIIFAAVRYEKIAGNVEWKNIFHSLESLSWKVRLSEPDKNYLLLVWLFIPIIVPFLISRYVSPMYDTRYTIVALPAFYLLIGKGIQHTGHRYLKFLVMSVIIGVFLLSLKGYYANVNKEQWRDVADYIETNAGDSDLLLFNAGICIHPVYDYYSKRAGLLKVPFPEKHAEVDEDNISELDTKVKDHETVWVILSHSRDNKGLIAGRLGRTYHMSFKKKYVGIEIYRFEKRKGIVQT